jgi:hypothetical protein
MEAVQLLAVVALRHHALHVQLRVRLQQQGQGLWQWEDLSSSRQQQVVVVAVWLQHLGWRSVQQRPKQQRRSVRQQQQHVKLRVRQQRLRLLQLQMRLQSLQGLLLDWLQQQYRKYVAMCQSSHSQLCLAMSCL